MTARWVAAGICVISVVYVVLARDFVTGFIADPIGPKAFPYLIGTLLAITSLALVIKPELTETVPLTWRQGILVTAIVATAALVELVGFVASSTALSTLTVALFGGPLRRGFVLSLILSLGVFAIFSYALAIPLPLGRWLPAGP